MSAASQAITGALYRLEVRASAPGRKFSSAHTSALLFPIENAIDRPSGESAKPPGRPGPHQAPTHSRRYSVADTTRIRLDRPEPGRSPTSEPSADPGYQVSTRSCERIRGRSARRHTNEFPRLAARNRHQKIDTIAKPGRFDCLDGQISTIWRDLEGRPATMAQDVALDTGPKIAFADLQFLHLMGVPRNRSSCRRETIVVGTRTTSVDNRRGLATPNIDLKDAVRPLLSCPPQSTSARPATIEDPSCTESFAASDALRQCPPNESRGLPRCRAPDRPGICRRATNAES